MSRPQTDPKINAVTNNKGGFLQCPIQFNFASIHKVIQARTTSTAAPKGKLPAAAASAKEASSVTTFVERPWQRSGVGAQHLSAKSKMEQEKFARDMFKRDLDDEPENDAVGPDAAEEGTTAPPDGTKQNSAQPARGYERNSSDQNSRKFDTQPLPVGGVLSSLQKAVLPSELQKKRQRQETALSSLKYRNDRADEETMCKVSQMQAGSPQMPQVQSVASKAINVISRNDAKSYVSSEPAAEVDAKPGTPFLCADVWDSSEPQLDGGQLTEGSATQAMQAINGATRQVEKNNKLRSLDSARMDALLSHGKKRRR